MFLAMKKPYISPFAFSWFQRFHVLPTVPCIGYYDLRYIACVFHSQLQNFISLATFKPQRIFYLEITKRNVKKTHEVFNKKIA